MSGHTRYWLRYILDCTDNAVMLQDVGANPDAVPPVEAKRLIRDMRVKKNKHNRLVITALGRKELK